MAAPIGKLTSGIKPFDPLVDDDGDNERPRSGLRKRLAPCRSFPLQWPTENKARYDLFDGWHDVAMQIADRHAVSFRFLAVTKKVVNWQTGTIKESNHYLAQRSGFCSQKTISRDVATAEALGIITLEFGWRKNANGKLVRSRVMKLALPQPLPSQIHLPDCDFQFEIHMDTRGPDLSINHMDTCGPIRMDTRGPITIEDTNSRLARGRL
ncbi:MULTISPECIES: hypothetical protein [unclassified Phyllobacterium]|uniref:hypothetical protein n=1 Tax=unclassified Phyllobacterium TaxID=2638441 RepID=UPI003012D5D3